MSASQSAFSLDETELKTRNNTARSVPAGFSRDEMNLAEFPLTVLSTRVNTEVKTLEFRDSIRSKNGELIEREWIITGADKFGLPTATDDDVILGLMCLTMDQGYRDRKVFFSRYELLKILRWSTEGRSYSRLSKSLDRLSGVRIRATNAFFDNSSKGFQTCNFGIIDAYEINDTRGSGEKSYFMWSEMLFDSFQSGFIKKIDLDFYFSLKSSVSRRLYRYLDKHFYHRATVEKPLLTLAFEKLGLSRSYQYVSSIKQQIEPAAEELMERGFLDGFEFQGRGATTIARFMQGQNFGKKLSAPRLPEQQEPREFSERKTANPKVIELVDASADRKRKLEERLQQHGLSNFQTSRLLAKKDENALQRAEQTVEQFEAMRARPDARPLANPLGFLYRAVEDGEKFPIPQPEKAQLRAAPKRAKAAATVQEQTRVQDGERLLNERATALLQSLPQEELLQLRKGIEMKLQCLKGILDGARFEEAIQGCLRDEMRKRLK